MSPSLVVLLLISIYGLQLLEAQPQEMKVSCSSTVSCNGGDDIGLMTVRECCVENPSGVAYRHTNNSCNPCIVFGFFQEEFTGVEGWNHVLEVGFQKGDAEVGHNLVFHINDTAGTARKGKDLDYSVKTGRVKVRLSNPRNIVLSFHADGTAQEGDENFTLALELISSSVLPSTTDAIFFRDTLNVTIKDNDMLSVTFQREVYTVVENEGSVEVCIVTNTGHMDKTKVVIELIPLLKGTDHSTPSNSDINTAPQTVFFEISDSKQKLCVTFEVYDDITDESDEDFIVKLSNLPNEQCVLGAIPQAYVTIRDNDVPEFSITPMALTVLESAGEAEICITTNSSLAREIEVAAEPGLKGGSHNPAKDVEMTAVTVTFLPSEDSKSIQTHCGIVRIIDDTIGNEPDEEFFITLISASPEGSFGDDYKSHITIRDDDIPEFNIDPQMRNITEPEGMVELCISTNSPLARNVTVTARTGPKSGAANQATADEDYRTTVMIVTFTSSYESTTQRLCGNVSIINDMIGNEPNEEFSVTLVSTLPPGGSFNNKESNITIIDDDVVGIDFSTMDVTVNENNGTVIVCLMKNIITDGPIIVILDAKEEPGVYNAASDTTDFEPGFGLVTFAPDQSEACGQVPIKNDNDSESPEVFMVTFTPANLIIPWPPNLPPLVAEVTIIDDDLDILTCRIDEILQVKPLTRTSDYRFFGICEFTALSSCTPIPGFDIRVTVDYITETLENGAVGLHVNNFHYVSREDGSFDDGGQIPISSTVSTIEYAATAPTRVRVSMGEEQTNITFDSNTPASDPLESDIEIIHNWGDANPNILISIRTPNSNAISDFCGLCGSLSGSLLRRDGTVADVTNMAEVQSFAESYVVPARDQILRPQRRECGTIRNDTLIETLYTAPVYSEDGKEYSLCFEVFGRANSTLNLVSDICVNVNARYGPMDNPADGNIIRAIGVRARGLSENNCHNILVDLEGCSASVETPNGNSQSLGSMERFENDGISVRKYPSRVRISAPNCENVMLVMWVICENLNNQDMIKFVIARGLNLRPSSHGLLGQFWNIPVYFTKYNGTDLPAGTDPSRVYVVTVVPKSSSARSFLGYFYHLNWGKSREPCLYVGNAQGGPSYEVSDPNDSAIEGRYRDYILQGGDENLFETNYTYSQFEETRCNS